MDRRHFITFLASMGALSTIPSVARSKDKALILGIFPRRNIKVTYKLITPMAQNLSQQL